MKKINFLNLKNQHQIIKQELFTRWKKLYENTEFVYASEGRRFEEDFSTYNRVTHAIAVDNGTSALEIALRAMGVGPGDEVITVSNTFIATAAAIHFTGATPVFAEIDSHTYNLDVYDLQSKITPKTKVIIPVNLYGQPADLIEIRRIADDHGLKVLNDAAQSIGSKIRDPKTGEWIHTHHFADITTFSFYPGKNLGACGEAGAIITNTDEYADFCRKFRDHGSQGKYIHEIVGRNHRIDALQAAALSVKLQYIDQWNASRRKIAAWYQEELNGLDGLQLPQILDNVQSVYHLYVVLVENRADFMAFLNEKGIRTALHYKIPIHLQKAFQHLGYKQGDLPITESVVSKNVSLPMFPELSREDIAVIGAAVREYLKG